MGFYSVSIHIEGKRSAHNSIDDKLDMARWDYLAERIRRLVEHDDFQRLDIIVNGPNE